MRMNGEKEVQQPASAGANLSSLSRTTIIYSLSPHSLPIILLSIPRNSPMISLGNLKGRVGTAP